MPSSIADEVAPLAGAWIEIMVYTALSTDYALSLPLRERGLKFHSVSHFGNPYFVAPLAGAWIEIK